ncbi:hypothetical protein [Breznakiella homolactica]|uniref:Uncharacterized protein n=1 Tax=Breznakiella homolactica TaxID=2798577 RepID=A0A7T7XPG0_9SPIR|nr:hypothetical protein [Breznakiella homolactica]QQO10076.1 hypothetical protein JFL75_03930 [Breznakiella homolactica]
MKRNTVKLHNLLLLLCTIALFPLLGSCASGGKSSEATNPHMANMQGFPRDNYEKEDINGEFPDAVYLKTRTQSFNTYHYYVVKDGLIWYKGITPESGPRDWILFMKTGLPNNSSNKKFRDPRAIVEISADADELVALSSDGQFYRICFDWIFSRKNNEWFDGQGWPAVEPLYIDKRTAGNVAWAMGKRNAQVLWYEDPFGNQHHNGTQEIATTYILLEDGQEICYGDTGLPSDFSRNYIGPERGSFKAAAMSASASTLFLINEAGEMYTRLADFDIIGCDPMFFKYTYVPYKSNLPGTNYRSNLTAWGLPSETWLKQFPITLPGQARLTRHITILQNGQGNAARELRVGGIDAQGKTGYWSKPIFENTWRFVEAPLEFAADDFLDTGSYPDGKGERGPSIDTAMRGYLWNGDTKDSEWLYEIPNFNLFEGECDLRITWNNETCTILLHPVEMWTYLKRDYLPGRNGPPKIFFVTLDIPPDAMDGLSESFKQELEQRIGDSDKKLFHYIMEAGTDYLLMQSQKSSDSGSIMFLTAGDVSEYLPEFNRSWVLGEFEEVTRYNSEDLIVQGGPVFQRNQYAEIQNKIELNKALQKELKERISNFESIKRSASRSRIAYSAIDFITHITLIYRIDVPKIYTITRFGGDIMTANDAYASHISDSRIWMDKKLLELLDLRIRSYSEVAEQLADGEPEAALPPGYAETSEGYWKVGGLPMDLDGTFRFGNTVGSAMLNHSVLEGDFMGWNLQVGEEPAFSVLVEPLEIAREIYGREGKPPEEKHYNLKALIHVISVGSSDSSRALFEKTVSPLIKDGKPLEVTITYDGEEFIIKKKQFMKKESIIFMATVP